jgi:hypothetical protein
MFLGLFGFFLGVLTKVKVHGRDTRESFACWKGKKKQDEPVIPMSKVNIAFLNTDYKETYHFPPKST